MKYITDPQVQTALFYTVIVLLCIMSAVIGKIKESKKIPASWQKWIDKISEAQIRQWIGDAQAMSNMTGSARRDYVVKCLENHVVDYLDDFIPHSVATMIVEYVYQRVEGRYAI